MKKLIAAVMVFSFASVGCTGSFNLTRKVYNFHRSQDNKWADELVFLGAVLLPVYSLSTLGDAIIFNSIEFWTGENPVMASSGKTEKVVKKGDTEAVIAYDQNTDQVTITTENETIILERNDFGVIAKDESGEVLYTSVTKSNGDIAIYDGNVELVKNISINDINDLKSKVLK